MAVMYSNPLRYKSRLHLFNNFRRYIATMPNVRLYVGEVAVGDRNWEVTSASNPDDFQFRTRDLLWHKENVLNQVIWRFDKSWEFGCWCDGDVMFNRQDWALETIHQLAVYDWVQPFSSHTDLGPNHEVLKTRYGMAYLYQKGVEAQVTGDAPPKDGESEYWRLGSPGFAWAFRREAFEACGSLMDRCVLGSADLHMAMGLIGSKELTYDTRECGDAYKKYIKIWQERAHRKVNRNVGFVNCALTHQFHGSRNSRGYNWRWKILRDHQYDPAADVFPDDEGLLKLTELKPGFRDAVRAYLASRQEDDLRVG
jgi:hypothetical protein